MLLKPDTVSRAFSGEILSRFEKAGLKIIGLKMLQATKEQAKEQYTEDIANRLGERIRELLVEYITEGPIIAICLEGVEAVEIVRKMAGSTYPNQAYPGTIRGDYAHTTKQYANSKNYHVKNLIHASATKEEAKIEVGIWFAEKELQKYKTVHEPHIIGKR